MKHLILSLLLGACASTTNRDGRSLGTDSQEVEELEDTSQPGEELPDDEDTGDDGGEDTGSFDTGDIDDVETPGWPPVGAGPWDRAVYLSRGPLGGALVDQGVLVTRSGVPQLLKLPDGTLIATFQHFSLEDYEWFDVFASVESTDGGRTWSDMRRLDIRNLPDRPGWARPVDPTLVRLVDGRFRIYFTLGGYEDVPAVVACATAADAEGPFTLDAQMDLELAEEARDPALVRFKGIWHWFAPRLGSPTEGWHATSKDGLHWGTPTLIDAGIELRGNPRVDGDYIVFYGSTPLGVQASRSPDGITWTPEDEVYVTMSGDPGAVVVEGAELVMVHTH